MKNSKDDFEERLDKRFKSFEKQVKEDEMLQALLVKNPLQTLVNYGLVNQDTEEINFKVTKGSFSAMALAGQALDFGDFRAPGFWPPIKIDVCVEVCVTVFGRRYCYKHCF